MSKDVKIILLNTKGEIQTRLKEAAKTFHQDHPDISAEILENGTRYLFERASADVFQVHIAGFDADNGDHLHLERAMYLE
ncbi:hypothetical protein [Paenibacillus ehimensis]|uniref:hypothetical protein n=1 Tax=Paenibacillus ehimensis TaxID=79264 RepID=UPI00046EE1E1|nr:hypothetical protein [Paenibacillus ehimensis]